MQVLLLMPGPLGERMSAPEVRGWEMARQLGRRHDVTVAVPSPSATERDGIALLALKRRSVVATARRVDAVVAPGIPPYLFAALADQPTLLVTDLYNPAGVEQADAGSDVASRLGLELLRRSDPLQLGFSDVVLCAVEAQRRVFAREIAALGRAADREPLLRVVPFGVDDEPPNPSERRPIRERFCSIAEDDVVVLWWGNVWPWFDAETALRAFAELARENPHVKLVITGGRPPRSEAIAMDRTAHARALASDLELLGTCVHFIDDWIPHAERDQYLLEADVGLTLHRDTAEKDVAARGRYMDYLWARLPCVLAAGDELADRFAAEGFAVAVPPGDVSAAAAALRTLIDDEKARSAARARAAPLLEAFRWSAAVMPLLDALDEVAGRRPTRAGLHRQLLARLARVYGYRLAVEATTMAERARRIR